MEKKIDFFLFHWSIDWLESSIIKVLYINQYRVCQLFFCFRKPSFSFDCFLDSLRQVVCAYCISNVKYEWHPMSLDLLNILQSITDKQCLGSNIESNFKIFVRCKTLLLCSSSYFGYGSCNNRISLWMKRNF